jgi:hypothetical protein
MLEEYLKRLEDIIVPQNYNKNNFREKIKADFEDPAEAEKKMDNMSRTKLENFISTNNEDEKKLLDEYIQKMGVSEESGKSSGKIKIYQKILDNEGEILANNNNIEVARNGSKAGKTYSLSPSRTIKSQDEGNLKEKIHMLNLKAMNYRYEIETLKNNLSELKSKLDEKDAIISKMERQKDADNKYLIKLEGIIASKDSGLNISGNKSKILSDKTLLSNIHSDGLHIDFNKSHLIIEDKANHTIHNFSDRNELKEFIANLITENQKLKAFQNGVFDLSKKYDDVNENMIDGMKQIGQYLNKGEIILDDGKKKDVIGIFKFFNIHHIFKF